MLRVRGAAVCKAVAKTALAASKPRAGSFFLFVHFAVDRDLTHLNILLPRNPDGLGMCVVCAVYLSVPECPEQKIRDNSSRTFRPRAIAVFVKNIAPLPLRTPPRGSFTQINIIAPGGVLESYYGTARGWWTTVLTRELRIYPFLFLQEKSMAIATHAFRAFLGSRFCPTRTTSWSSSTGTSRRCW